jgi:putative methionine-R-sulfoxide reductase with GAF domain
VVGFLAGFPQSAENAALTALSAPVTLQAFPKKSSLGLRVKRIRSSREVLAGLDRALAAKPADPFERVVELLYDQRRYFWVGIYLVAGERVVRQAFRGPVPPCRSFAFGKGNVGTAGQTGLVKVIPDVSQDATYSMCFLETKSELVVPTKIVGRVLGVIDVESDRPDAFGPRDQILLKEVARRLARFLTSTGKRYVRKAKEAAQREAEAEPVVPAERGRPPAPEKPAAASVLAPRRAVAGDLVRP